MAFGKDNNAKEAQPSVFESHQTVSQAVDEQAAGMDNPHAGAALTTRPEVSLANLDALLDQEMGMALEGIDPRPPRIKVSREAQVFMMPDGTSVKALTGVITFNHKARGRWETEGQPLPTCSSMDGITGTDENGVQHPCAGCKYNAWGSGKDDRGKACKEMRWVYFLQDDEIIPSRISLPPTSLGKFDTFISALVQKKKAPITKTVRLGLEKTERHGFSYSVLAQPEVLGDVPPERIVEILKLRDTAVAAAKKAGVTADDYDTSAEVVGDNGAGGNGEAGVQPY